MHPFFMQFLTQTLEGYTTRTQEVEKTFTQTLHALVNTGLIGCGVFLVWLFIFAKVLRPFRVNAKGTPKDNTLFITFIMVGLAIACTVLSMPIYQDFDMALSNITHKMAP